MPVRGIPTMAHQYSCSSCEFQVRSEDENELIDIVREHANDMHQLNVSRGDVRDGMQTV